MTLSLKTRIALAVKVLGWKSNPPHPSNTHGKGHLSNHKSAWVMCPTFTTGNDTLMLIEAIRKKGYEGGSAFIKDEPDESAYAAAFVLDGESYDAQAPTLPEAVALAACKALDIEVEYV